MSDNQVLTSPEGVLSSRRWSAALFTTYAFSISFFESVVFQALTKRTSCHEISVLVDAHGYESSLMERGAGRVGRDYTLVPILAPGVFHPKCTYLSGPDGDILLVGSGNLTFGGYGRNVEVLHLLQPETTPQVFLDFADFLEALATRPGLQIPNAVCTAPFAKRARAAANASKSLVESSNLRLLHSTDRSIVSQIVEYGATYGSIESLTVLSPFHDPNASAIVELATRAKCNDLRIALPPNPAETSTFPFHTDSISGLNVIAVRPKVDEAIGRPLHAKWFEMATARGIVTLTGSVNATYPALCTTKNIEVAIIQYSSDSVKRWEPATIPTSFTAPVESSSDAPKRILAYARLTAGGNIHGNLMTNDDVEGAWSLRFEKAGQNFLDVVVEVDQARNFTASCDRSNEILSVGTMRVVLHQGEREAVGWLEMDELVRMSLEQRTIFGALSRFLSKRATDDDDVSLLNYLAMSSLHHLNDLVPDDTKRAAPKVPLKPDGTGGKSIPTIQIAPSTGGANSQGQVLFSNSSTDTLSHWFRQFRDQVLSPSNINTKTRENKPQRLTHPSEVGEEPEDLQEQMRTIRALAQFDSKMLETLRENIVKMSDCTKSSSEKMVYAETRRKLLCIWHEVTIYMLCHRLETPEDCPLFLRRWLGYAREFASAKPEAAGELEKLFFTSVAILAWHAMQEESTETLQLLHQSIEQFLGSHVTAEYANANLDPRWESGAAQSILGISNPTLGVYLSRVLDTRTSLDEIQALFVCLTGNKPVDFLSGIFVTVNTYGHDIGSELHSKIEAGNYLRFFRFRYDERVDCSCCNLRFTETAKANYVTRRVAKCSSCGKFNLRLHA